jgi:oligosaccharyltransferase complex subunit delta (ribophorin II)
VVIGSFGPSPAAYNSETFSLAVDLDGLEVPVAAGDKPLRYGKLPEIRHVFRSDPKSPPMIISVAFLLAVLASLPPLLAAVRPTLSLSCSY